MGFAIPANGSPLSPKPTGNIFVQTSEQTIANTVTETTMFNGGVGTLTVPANTLAVGKILRVRMAGRITDTGTPSTTLSIKLGGVTMFTSTLALPAALTDAGWYLWCEIVPHSTGVSGQFDTSGLTNIAGTGALGNVIGRTLASTVASTINTTINNVLDLTYTWGTASASNTITIESATVQIVDL